MVRPVGRHPSSAADSTTRHGARGILGQLSSETGGEHESLATYGGLVGSLHSIASQLSTQVPLCFVPADCGDTEARVTLTHEEAGTTETVEVTVEIPASCE